MKPHLFARKLLAWFERHGRHDLPWQRDPTPYRVWLSEVMLQQTRVETVIPYFERFTARFPDVAPLAAAERDEVLHLWSGLGYYARGRNLHAAARRVMAEHDGRLPRDATRLAELPGIGRSTAAAILAQAWGERAAILDGNVKRVLARFHAVEGWPGSSPVQRTLWSLAERYTPNRRVAHYTQASMDLGATVCTRSTPDCGRCPVAAGCRALAAGRVAELPTPRPARTLPTRRVQWLLIEDGAGSLLLERRPPGGIWGGLWCFPEIAAGGSPEQWCAERFGLRVQPLESPSPLSHTFSHFRLEIVPRRLRVAEDGRRVVDEGAALWYKSEKPGRLGLPAPVRRVLEGYAGTGS